MIVKLDKILIVIERLALCRSTTKIILIEFLNYLKIIPDINVHGFIIVLVKLIIVFLGISDILPR